MFSRAKKPKATTTTPFFSFLLPSKNNLFSSAANTRASDGAEVLEKNERNPECRRSVVVCARLLVSLFLHVLFFFEKERRASPPKVIVVVIVVTIRHFVLLADGD
tara:strand:+ start:3441 stop:3755 length:315 start_codon:yes stop_codon:yes gene_type:complete